MAQEMESTPTRHNCHAQGFECANTEPVCHERYQQAPSPGAAAAAQMNASPQYGGVQQALLHGKGPVLRSTTGVGGSALVCLCLSTYLQYLPFPELFCCSDNMHLRRTFNQKLLKRFSEPS